MAMIIQIQVKSSGEYLIMQEFATIDEAILWLNRFEEIVKKEVE